MSADILCVDDDAGILEGYKRHLDSDKRIECDI